MAQELEKTTRRALRDEALRAFNGLAPRLHVNTVAFRASTADAQELLKQLYLKVESNGDLSKSRRAEGLKGRMCKHTPVTAPLGLGRHVEHS